MARDLLYQAQLQGAVQVAPEVAALSEALQQARADRDSAIHTAAAASAGIAGAIKAAGPSVRAAYGDARKATKGSQELADASFRSLGGAAAPFAAAASRERSVGEGVLASSLANSLKELSDRRISNRAGAAFAKRQAVAQYEGKTAQIAQKRQQVAQREGLYTANALAKLEQHQADQEFRAALQASQQTFQGEQNRLSRKNSRLNSIRQADAVSERQEDSQSFQARQNALGRRQQKLSRQESARQFNARQGAAGQSDGPKPTAGTVFKGRQTITQLREAYKDAGAGKMHEVAKGARGDGLPPELINAAADLHSRGYIRPNGIRALKNIGVTVPKEWTGQVVKPYVRKRKRRSA